MNGSEGVHKAPGCDSDFLNKLHERAFDIAPIIGLRADYSIDSLRYVDDFIRETRAKGNEINRETLCCLVAYCGEIIRRQVNGDWAVEQYNDRWFPFIVRNDGSRIDFYGIVDNVCFSDDRKYWLKEKINGLSILKPFSIKSEKWTDWIFPPVKMSE